MEAGEQRVLVLGAGINGAAVARELLLNDVPVCVVDTSDIACGATAASSRLIHGGLRYLEYGEFDLVRESLAERGFWLESAPHLVQPLQLHIPLSSRWGGFWPAVRRFFGRSSAAKSSAAQRGLWLVRIGLMLYDLFAAGTSLPKRSVQRVGDAGMPPVDDGRFRWLCSYWDAQVTYPERLTVALLEDARRQAEERRIWFRVLPYHRAMLRDALVDIRPIEADSAPVTTFEAAAIVNATGAWIDDTLERLPVAASRLIGGTKGSHLVTHHQGLRDSLDGAGLYVEAADARPVFLLPWLDATLVGTTDLPFEGDPHDVAATDEELEYLLRAVNDVFPQVQLDTADIDACCCGVRPLPLDIGKSPGAVTRHHQIVENHDAAMPIYSLVGGKLTTSRALAEETVDKLLAKLKRKRQTDSRRRVVPGGEEYPRDGQLRQCQQEAAADVGCSLAQVQAVWPLCGTRTIDLVSRDRAGLPSDDFESLAGTSLPIGYIRRVIESEWVTHLRDLVERRLMLVYHPDLSLRSLRQLARLMVDAKVIGEHEIEPEVEECRRRLQSHYRRQID